jgi:hypothetical protein
MLQYNAQLPRINAQVVLWNRRIDQQQQPALPIQAQKLLSKSFGFYFLVEEYYGFNLDIIAGTIREAFFCSNRGNSKLYIY